MGRSLRLGLFSPYFGSTFGGGEKYLGVLAEALRDNYSEHTIEILAPVPVDRERYRRVLNVDLDGIGLVSTTGRVTPLHRAANRIGPLRPLRNLVIGSQADRATAGYDLLLAMVYAIPVRSRARRSVMLCQFPYPNPDRRDIEPYELIISQSEYVRGWVREYWKCDAEVVNPPIDPPRQPVELADKEPLVLAVGRFFASGHSKRQDLLVESFRSLCDGGLAGWTLHLAGSVHRDAVHAGYYASVVARAAGYPIVFHPDAPHAEVEDLYRRASIFWHAAGSGIDARAEPANLEHFGMTTAEAMGAGALPLAYGVGGQAEVITDGADGFLWKDVKTLEERTLQLTRDTALRERLALAAAESMKRFSRETFKHRMLDLLGPIIRELETTAK